MNTQQKIIEIISEILGFHTEKVELHHDLVTDLGADSLDYEEIICAIEEEFDVVLPEGLLKVGELVEAVEKNK